MTTLHLVTADVRVDLEVDDERLAVAFRDVASPWVVEDGAVEEATQAQLVLTAAVVGSLDVAVAQAVSDVDRAALSATTCLAIHAACVAGPSGAVVIPGRSGAGKSTLAGACMQRGLVLLSDEAACLRPGRDDIAPHARPLGLSGSSRRILGLPVLASEADPDEVAVCPSLLGTSARPDSRHPPVLVAIPQRVASEPASIVAVPTSQALRRLLENCLNVPTTTPSTGWSASGAWGRLTLLAAAVDCVELRYDDPHDAARLLASALDR